MAEATPISANTPSSQPVPLASPATSEEAHTAALQSDAAKYLDQFVSTQDQMRNTLPAEHPSLNVLWGPSAVRSAKAHCYLKHTPVSAPVYGPALPSSQNGVAAAFGGLAYHVDREIVFSAQNGESSTLSEIGSLSVADGSARHQFNAVLKESDQPTDRPGTQYLIADTGLGGAAWPNIQAALISGTTDLVSVSSAPGKGCHITDYDVRFRIPADKSWDGTAHEMHLRFSAPNPKGHGLLAFLMKLFGKTNGRPAQHYQDLAAAVINLQEIFFAQPKSVILTVDGVFCPVDRLGPFALALLLTQTAGGFFERDFMQTTNTQGGLNFTQHTALGNTALPVSQRETRNTAGQSVRFTDVAPKDAAYTVRYVEQTLRLPDARSAHELTQMEVASPDGQPGDLMTINFSAGTDAQGVTHGLRDLGLASSVPQNGRFAIALNEQDGFAYGTFTVEPTRKLSTDPAHPVYYTEVILTPEFSPDMAKKRIILHVLHTPDGVYTRTQVVPLQLVIPPAAARP